MTEFERKKTFVQSLGMVLRIDERSNVKAIDLVKERDMEIINITYVGGHSIRINATVNSNGENATEIIKEVYGSGAFWRMSK